MLRAADLQALGVWCQDHRVTWSATRRDGADLAVILEPETASRAWQCMRLVLDAPELRLEDETGQALACASDLPALLDAMDGGLADIALSRQLP